MLDNIVREKEISTPEELVVLRLNLAIILDYIKHICRRTSDPIDGLDDVYKPVVLWLHPKLESFIP